MPKVITNVNTNKCISPQGKLEIKSLKLKFSNLKYNKKPQQTVGQPRSKATKHSLTSKVFLMFNMWKKVSHVVCLKLWHLLTYIIINSHARVYKQSTVSNTNSDINNNCMDMFALFFLVTLMFHLHYIEMIIIIIITSIHSLL